MYDERSGIFDASAQDSAEVGPFKYVNIHCEKVFVEPPTRYAQITRDFLRNPILQGAMREALGSGMVEKRHIFSLLAYVAAHDRKHLSSIQDFLNEHTCVVLTEYKDIATTLGKNAKNGAVVISDKDDLMAYEKDFRNNYSKTVITNHRMFNRFLSQGSAMIYGGSLVVIADFPFKSAPNPEVPSYPGEVILFPVMGHIYSATIAISQATNNDTVEREINSAIEAVIPRHRIEDDSKRIELLITRLDHLAKSSLREADYFIGSNRDPQELLMVFERLLANSRANISKCRQYIRDLDRDTHRDEIEKCFEIERKFSIVEGRIQRELIKQKNKLDMQNREGIVPAYHYGEARRRLVETSVIPGNYPNGPVRITRVFDDPDPEILDRLRLAEREKRKRMGRDSEDK